MVRQLTHALAGALGFFVAVTAHADTTAFINAHLLPISQAPIEGGTLVVSDGFASMTTSATALVLNVPPSVDVGDDAEINEGDTIKVDTRTGQYEERAN